MAIRHRIAGRTEALLRLHPAIRSPQKREAVRHLALMLLERDAFAEKVLDGKLSGPPALRAVADLNRAVIDLMARLGMVPGLPRAGDDLDDDQPDDDQPEPEEPYESNLQRRIRILQAEEAAPKSRRAGKQKGR